MTTFSTVSPRTAYLDVAKRHAFFGDGVVRSPRRALLEHHKYKSARHLGIRGGSAGGFLMGLAITRNPSIYRAVNSEVGVYDLIRWELTPNGAYNVTEFETTERPQGSQAVRLDDKKVAKS